MAWAKSLLCKKSCTKQFWRKAIFVQTFLVQKLLCTNKCLCKKMCTCVFVQFVVHFFAQCSCLNVCPSLSFKLCVWLLLSKTFVQVFYPRCLCKFCPSEYWLKSQLVCGMLLLLHWRTEFFSLLVSFMALYFFYWQGWYEFM